MLTETVVVLKPSADPLLEACDSIRDDLRADFFVMIEDCDITEETDRAYCVEVTYATAPRRKD